MADNEQQQQQQSAQGRQCSEFGPAAHRTVALAIDLVGETIRHAPQTLERILQNEKVQTALATALRNAAQEMMRQQAQGQAVTFGLSMRRLGAAAGETLRRPATQQIQRSAEYRRLESGLRDLGCAFEASPVGAFVNENKTLLIILGSVAAIAGGVGMYYARAGDVPARAAGLLSELSPIRIGRVNVSATNVEFVPSERRVGVDVRAAGRWESVRASLNLGATFAEDTLAGGRASGELVLTLGPRTEGSAATSFTWSRSQAEARDNLQASAQVGVQHRVSSRANLSVQLFGQFADVEESRSARAGARASYSVRNPFGPQTEMSLGADYSSGYTQRRTAGALQPSQEDHRVTVSARFRF